MKSIFLLFMPLLFSGFLFSQTSEPGAAFGATGPTGPTGPTGLSGIVSDSMKAGVTDSLLINTNALVVRTNGKVGIGTSVPDGLLHVFSVNTGATVHPSFDEAVFEASSSGISILSGDAGTAGIAFGSPSNNLNVRLLGNYDLGVPLFRMFVGTSERLRVDNTGSMAIGTSVIGNSAILELSSTTKGFLPPRITTIQRDAIATPADGLVIYNTDNKSIEFYNGTIWNEKAICISTRTTNQSISNNVNTNITFPTEETDILGMHSIVSNTDQIVIPTGQGGFYLIQYGGSYEGNTTGYRYLVPTINNIESTPSDGMREQTLSTADAWIGNGSTIKFLNSGDIIRLRTKQKSGGVLNILNSRLSIIKIVL